MILIRLALLLLLLLEVSTTVTSTQELDTKTFLKLAHSGRNGMVKFYQPWCGHCTAMKPVWDELAAFYHVDDDDDNAKSTAVYIADVNCSEQVELCNKSAIEGYPTIKIYKDRTVTEYSGGRSLEELKAYVNANLVPKPKCNVHQLKETCSAKAMSYAAKWKVKDAATVAKEIARLSVMLDQSMTADLKDWFRERLWVLQQLPHDTAEESPRENEL